MACGCCCKKKVEPADQIIYKPYKERKCTDCFFCILFIVFWLGMVVIAIVGMQGGDPLRLLYGVDYENKVCGSGDYANRKFVYYPRITEDILTYAQSVGGNPLTINPLDIKLYGVCLDACPALGDVVCNTEGESNLKTLMGDLGYTDGTVEGTASQRLQATVKAGEFSTYTRYSSARKVKSGCWVVPLKTKDYFFRCMWVREENSNTTSICESPESLKGVDVSENNPDVSDDVKNQCVTKRTRTEKETTGAGQSNPLMDQMLDAAALMGRYVSDAQKAVLPILICGGILALIMGFIWLVILQHLAWCMVWLTIWLVLFALILGTLFAYFKAGLIGQDTINSITDAAGTSRQDLPLEVESSSDADIKTRWEYFAYFMTAVTIIITLLVVAMRRKINVAIGIIKEAARAVKSMPLMMTFPFCSVLIVVVLFSYWVIVAGYIYSNGDISAGDISNVAAGALNSVGSNLLCPVNTTTGQPMNSSGCAGAALGSTFASSSINNYLLLYHFFGLLWTVNFVTGFFTMAIAGAVCFWYFTVNKSHKRRVPVMTGLKTTLMKHLGSVAFGSMIIAIVQLLRAILAYIDRKSKKLQDKNKFLKILFKCLACCLWCFEKCVKYVANSAYIMVAMKGKSFCPAAFEAVMLLIKNIAQVGVLNTVSAFLFALGKLFIMGACGTIVFLWIDNDTTYTEGDSKLSSFWMPVLLTLILAYAVGSAFMNVYELTIDTVLLCYCVDIGRSSAGTADCPYYASPTLLKAVGKSGAVSHKDPGRQRRGSLDDVPPVKDVASPSGAGAGVGLV